MHCTAFAMDEVMAWVDALSITTGLAPSVSLSLYAELCRFESVHELIKEITAREAMFLRCDDMGNPHLMEAYSHTYIAHQDEQLEARDSKAMADRNEHYFKVLTHHGFKPAFINAFLENLSPTGDYVPEPFEIKSKRALVKGYITDPYYAPRQMKTRMPSPFEELQNLFKEVQLHTPMSPQGWVAVVKAIGLTVCKGSINNAWKFGEPSFHIEDDADPIPVFIVGVLNPPYIPNPSLDEAERVVGEYLSSRQNRRGILFTGPPIRIGNDSDEDCLVYWGRIYSDDEWYPLILHAGSGTIDQIVKVGITAHAGIEKVDLASQKDVGGHLLQVFASHHLDPTAELFSRESSSKSIH